MSDFKTFSEVLSKIKQIESPVEPDDNVAYSDFMFLYHPQKSTSGKAIAVIANFFLFFFPFVSIYFTYRLFNMYFLKVRKNTIQHLERVIEETPDRRYKTGYRITRDEMVATYTENKSNLYYKLNKEESKAFSSFATGFMAATAIVWIVSPYHWVSMPIAILISFLVSKSKNKKQNFIIDFPTFEIDYQEAFKNSVAIHTELEPNGSVKFIDYEAPIVANNSIWDVVQFRVFSPNKALDLSVQIHLTFIRKKETPLVSAYKSAVNELAKLTNRPLENLKITEVPQIDNKTWAGRIFKLNNEVIFVGNDDDLNFYVNFTCIDKIIAKANTF